VLRHGFRAAGIAALTVTLLGGISAAAGADVASAPRWHVAYSSATVMSGLTDIVALSASDVWAVGDVQPMSGPQRPFVRRWNGRTWSSVTLPHRYSSAYLQVVAGSSATNVWVFGAYDIGGRVHEFALRWDGSWSLRGEWVSDNGVGAAAVITPRDVWVFGRIGTWHFNGTKWTIPSVPFLITGVSVLSGNDIWAAGESLTIGPVLARYHNGSWTATALPHIPSSYPGPVALDVVALSDRNVWVVGGTVTAAGFDRPLAMHWSAGRWHRPRFPVAYNSWLNSVVPDGSGGLWAAYEGPYGGSIMAHFAGGQWHKVTMPHVAGKNTAVFVLSRVPRSATVFAAGSSFWGHYPDTSALVLKYSR
jgi:hypothetical protein